MTRVLAFFKISCPTCQLAFPFLERIHSSGTGLEFTGISQDDDAATEQFLKRYGITFPVRLDRASAGYPESKCLWDYARADDVRRGTGRLDFALLVGIFEA